MQNNDYPSITDCPKSGMLTRHRNLPRGDYDADFQTPKSLSIF